MLLHVFFEGECQRLQSDQEEQFLSAYTFRATKECNNDVQRLLIAHGMQNKKFFRLGVRPTVCEAWALTGKLS